MNDLLRIKANLDRMDNEEILRIKMNLDIMEKEELEIIPKIISNNLKPKININMKTITPTKLSHDAVIDTVKNMYKEQEQVLNKMYGFKNLALLSDDIEYKKEMQIKADQTMDVAQQLNFGIRKFMENNPVT